jgi:hypothetical protein
LPEVIAYSSVLAGNNVKDPTVAQTFGAISAYDGDQAGVGRVVTDATWHHFVNINLVGVAGSSDPVKAHGFLATTQGQAYLEDIKAYYRNIAIWIAPARYRTCMRRHITWYLLWDHRLLEAVTAGAPVRLELADITSLLAAGRHARDALGKFAGQCQSEQWILDWFRPLLPRRIWEVLYPWPVPRIEKKLIVPPPEPDPVPWFDPEPVLDLALGGGIIALREAFPEPDPGSAERAQAVLDQIVLAGATRALERAQDSIALSIRGLESLRAHLKRGSAARLAEVNQADRGARQRRTRK